ncbi:acyltransferase family protein [Pseudomonadota bacterium]
MQFMNRHSRRGLDYCYDLLHLLSFATKLATINEMKYRAEIDGLRAVAVMPVILFHAGFEHFSGGFIGVDVFFVISGYLITTIILSEMEQGTFSLVNFYDRRARRILPALFLIMFVSLFFSWIWLMPSDMKDFSQSLVAVSTFSSNILFWRETGYWAPVNELKPLLHTWSLAVEEQYYVLFPLFMMLMWRFRKRWILSTFMVITAISLVVSQWGAYYSPQANFFLLPTRGWELAIGASIAFYFLHRKQPIRTLLSHHSVDEVLGMAGLLMIGYAVYAFDESVPFPSVYALIPTIGTALIILFSSPQTLVGRLLGTKLLVGIGLISYSAYLWHYPLFAFARHSSLTKPDDLIFTVLAALSFPLAYLSWKYVERPFRKKGGVSRKSIFAFSATGSVVFIAIGMAGYMTDGFDNRSTKSNLTLQSIEEKWKVNHGLSKSCEGSFTLSPNCRTSEEPEILVWGDSYAMHLVQGILASNPDAKIIQMTKSRCGPFFDVAPVLKSRLPTSWAKGCLEFTGKVREWLKENNTIKYAVLSSPFTQYLKKDKALLYRSGNLAGANIDLAVKEFRATLSELETMGITPIVFSPPPQNGINLGRCLARAEWTGLNLDKCNFRVDDISQNQINVYRFLETINEKYRVVRLDKLICDSSLCNTHFGPTFIYRDSQHLSHEGSAELGKKNHFYGMIVDRYSN